MNQVSTSNLNPYYSITINLVKHKGKPKQHHDISKFTHQKSKDGRSKKSNGRFTLRAKHQGKTQSIRVFSASFFFLAKIQAKSYTIIMHIYMRKMTK